MSNSETPRTAASQASLSFTLSWSLLRSMSIVLRCHPSISFLSRPFSPPALNAEAEAPVLWPPDVKADSREKTLMLGKAEEAVRRPRFWHYCLRSLPVVYQRLLVSLKSYSCKIILSTLPSVALGSDNSLQITH